MKNLLKKFAVFAASVAMVMTTFAVPTFAQDGPVTINGLEEDVVATFYKIADVEDDGTIKRIAAVPKTVINDLEKPQSDEIQKLAAKASTTLTAAGSKTVAKGATSVTSDNLAPGIYLATFSVAEGGNPDYIYNPVIVSVNQDGAGSAASVSAGGTYSFDELEEGEQAKAKRSTVTFDKVVERDLNKIAGQDKGANAENGNTTGDEKKVNADPEAGLDGNRGDTAAAGEVVSFRINTQIPAYADNYFTAATGGPAGTSVTKDPGYEIYDDFDGLTLEGNVAVYSGTTTLNAGTDYILTVKEDKSGYDIKFTGAGVWKYRGQAIEVRYAAKVKDNAERVNFNGDTNTARNKYTREPGANPTDADQRTTYHYKFTINGKIDGKTSRENREVLKVGTDVNGDPIFKEEVEGITEEGWTPLGGVKFYLYETQEDANDNDSSKAIREVTSRTGDGILEGMSELDAGNYWLVEAPKSEQAADFAYAVDETPISISIEAKLLDDGRLESYMVKVGGHVVGNYKKTYEKPEGTATDFGAAKGTETILVGGTWNEVNGETVGDGTIIPAVHKVKVNNKDREEDDYGVAVDIRNSKVGTLPSTGGMGTILFTVGGIVIIGLAFLLLFGGRRRQHQK